MEIDEEYIDKGKSLIEQKDAENVKTLLTDLHPADIAELCNDLGLEEARFVYRLLDNETAADVLVEICLLYTSVKGMEKSPLVSNCMVSDNNGLSALLQ